MQFELYDDLVPKTVENFKKLVNECFYDGLRFNRIVRCKMLETGDPLSKDILQKLNWGTGGPGYNIKKEISKKLKHNKKGLLSMASVGDECSGSRFVITYSGIPSLDGKNTVFGHIVSGEDVLDILGNMGTDRGGKVEFIGYIVLEKVTVV
ncbi:MAG: peptidylprolyl isomerase [Nanoarchaeota archaeon]|nr:peptidylprolyl isomerase [Nanoarchaeota archaeon]